MNTVIHAVGFSADVKLESLIEKKISKLASFYDKILNTDVYLKLDTHEQIKDKTVEIKVKVPGQILFVSNTTKTFEESIDNAMDSISRLVKKHKDKIKK